MVAYLLVLLFLGFCCLNKKCKHTHTHLLLDTEKVARCHAAAAAFTKRSAVRCIYLFDVYLWNCAIKGGVKKKTTTASPREVVQSHASVAKGKLTESKRLTNTLSDASKDIFFVNREQGNYAICATKKKPLLQIETP
jgi:hypothetical protein